MLRVLRRKQPKQASKQAFVNLTTFVNFCQLRGHQFCQQYQPRYRRGHYFCQQGPTTFVNRNFAQAQFEVISRLW